MTFHARYPGRCADCGERIDENDLIAVTDDGAICADCEGGIDAHRRPDPPVCQTCWLAHPASVNCDEW